jgi:hypothetical protein
VRARTVKYTVDIYDERRPPEVGQNLRHISYKGVVKGYLRLVGVRQVQVRVSRGEVARFRLELERLPGIPQDGVQLTVWDHTPKPKRERFSPLL